MNDYMGGIVDHKSLSNPEDIRTVMHQPVIEAMIDDLAARVGDDDQAIVDLRKALDFIEDDYFAVAAINSADLEKLGIPEGQLGKWDMSILAVEIAERLQAAVDITLCQVLAEEPELMADIPQEARDLINALADQESMVASYSALIREKEANEKREQQLRDIIQASLEGNLIFEARPAQAVQPKKPARRNQTDD